MSVAVTAGEKFEKHGLPTVLFRIPGSVGLDRTRPLGYDVSPDGRRFLVGVLSSTAQEGSSPFNVVLNWQIRTDLDSG